MAHQSRWFNSPILKCTENNFIFKSQKLLTKLKHISDSIITPNISWALTMCQKLCYFTIPFNPHGQGNKYYYYHSHFTIKTNWTTGRLSHFLKVREIICGKKWIETLLCFSRAELTFYQEIRTQYCPEVCKSKHTPYPSFSS